MICDLNLTSKGDGRRFYYCYCPHLTNEITGSENQYIGYGVELGCKV